MKTLFVNRKTVVSILTTMLLIYGVQGIFLLICLSIPLTATAQTVNIPDPNLRAAIESELGKASGDTITADEMATLTQLEARDVDIRVLTGLERATNLTRLILFNASISDLSPLAGLTNLTTLDLVGGSISDLSPLAGLTQLTRLDLVDHSISDLSPLVGLTNLTFLSLVYSPISDISPLAGLTQLTTLYLYNNSISDISPLAGLTQLTLLLLQNNSISDISPLVTNTGLGNGDLVDMRGNPLSDASINTHIPALQRRWVTVEFDDIVVQPEDMAQMGDIPDPNLRAAIEAALGKASGDTITADEMATLTQLEVEIANISNLTGLERATNLTRLAIAYNPISDISPLAGLTNLTTLELSSGSISDISPLAGLTNLTTLELSSPFISDISDISPLAGLTQLTILRLNNHSIADLSPLAGLTNLTILSLYNNSISDISPLAGLTNLTFLDLDRNNISDISPLTGLTNLTRLELSNTFISDLSPLVANTGLGKGDQIDVSENPLSDASINTHMPALQSKGVTVVFNGMIFQPGDIVVDIPDPNLRAAVEAELGKASGDAITADEMEALRILLAPNANISDLTGLERATYLRELNLGAEEAEGRFVNSNSVSDLSPLAGLTRLTKLGLENNFIANISPLAGLTLLRFLGLWENSIADLSPLAGLTRLTNLRLRTNNITDLSPLAGLTNLTWLDLGNNSISDISHLEGLTHLTTLNLEINSISDISPLVELTNLTTLDLEINSISDISPLAGLTYLSQLGLSENSISDISPLAGLTRLRFLGLGTNNITDISPLVDIFFLRILGLGANNITDISPVARLTQLTDLNLENNSISDLLPLARLNKLTFLDLDSNSISDISPLVANTGLGNGDTVYLSVNPLNSASINTHIPALVSRGVTVHFGDIVIEPETVDIPDPNLRAAIEAELGKASGDTIATNDMETLTILLAPNANIGDLTGLEHATNLTKLNLGAVEGEGINSNSVSDLSPLAGLTKLTTLGLDYNSIANISPLAGLTNLTGLVLNNNSIADISPVAGLTKLTILWLHNNSVADISPLTGLTNLTTLDLHNNSISDISPLTGLTQLRQLSLRDNSISDISPLAGLTQLTLLGLNNNSISGISPLARLTNLTTLVLNNNSISDVSPLAGLTNLTHLGLDSNSVSDLSSLAGLNKLTTLGLDNNSISDISPLAGLTNLTFLDLDKNSIADISPLVANTGLGNGDVVGVSGNPLNSASINTNIPALQTRGVTVEFDDIVALPADVNNDGSVNILDLVLVASVLGDEGRDLDADVNGDGIVNILDLVLVAGAFGNTAAAPALRSQALSMLTAADVQGWLAQARELNLTDVASQRGIVFLEQLLSVLIPTTTTSLMAIEGTIKTEDGIPAEAGLEVTVIIGSNTQTGVSEIGGVYTVTILNLQGTVVATSGDTVTVQVRNPDTGASVERTVQLSSQQILAKQATIDLQFSPTPSPTDQEYLLSVPKGISLIHVPLKVTAVDGVAQTLESVGDLYDALGGAATVELLITYDPETGRWNSYLHDGYRGRPGDRTLTDDLGIIASMKVAKSVLLSGDALGTNGRSSITLHPGINLVGVPLKDSRITRVSDLLKLNGIAGNVFVIIVSDNGFKVVAQAGDPGDIPVTGGGAFILTARNAATVEITGTKWSTPLGQTAAPSTALTGLQTDSVTPVLAVTGSISSVGNKSLSSPFRVTVKNLSTGRVDTAMTDDDGVTYQFTFVDIETGRAAQVGDILEITADSPDPFVGIHPVRYTVTGEDVKRSHIPLAELVAYEIPAKTELLLNYPNPFNPETWIPYRLAKDAFVTLTIYDPRGRVVRRLDVGLMIAAVYESRAKAVYWDGRNRFGERVASGIYFYTLTAGDYSATRKMVILK